jgi:ribose 1,5-bisphosphokinase PhnN
MDLLRYRQFRVANLVLYRYLHLRRAEEDLSGFMICIGGLSGTGKSTLVAFLAPMISPPPGAIHIRSDIERKILAGVEETIHLAPEHYLQLNAQKIYDLVLDRAKRALAAGIFTVFGFRLKLKNSKRALLPAMGCIRCNSGCYRYSAQI